MYLVISEYNFQNNQPYYSCRGNWLDEVKALFPDYNNLSPDDIDEILIYSNKKENAELFARTVECSGYEAEENYLRINYGDVIEDHEINCGFVRKNIYTVCLRKKLLKDNKFIPSLLFIDDIQAYKYIKNGSNKNLVNQTLLDQLTGLFSSNDWIGIVKNCPVMDKIEQDPIWNDPECLGKLSFALSKLATRTKKNPTSQDIQRKKENTDFFLKVNKRCIELEPYSSMHKSTLAYFLYDRYKATYNEEDFEQAKALYEELIDTSVYNFKEKYRFANLLRKHYELPKNLYQTDSYKEFNTVISEYELLLQGYDNLTDKEKQNQRNNYLKALYQYVGLQQGRVFDRYWDLYFDNRVFQEEIPDYLINNTTAALIKKCDDFLSTVETMIPDAPTPENVNDKPGYFDVHYRKAQLTLAKAFLLLLRNFPKERYMPYLEEAEKKLSSLLEEAKQLKANGGSFTFPNHIKFPLAICYYFEGKPEECGKCFYKALPWMQYEQARICYLYGDVEQAIAILEKIPENDLCKNKSDDLLVKISE